MNPIALLPERLIFWVWVCWMSSFVILTITYAISLRAVSQTCARCRQQPGGT